MVRLDSQTFPFTLQSQVACSVSNNELLYHKNFMLLGSNFSIAQFLTDVKNENTVASRKYVILLIIIFTGRGRIRNYIF